jgi:hypothetical protein
MVFWANVRSIGEVRGYTERGAQQVKVHTLDEMCAAMGALRLGSGHLRDAAGSPTTLGADLLAYFRHRADMLNGFVEPRLMDVRRARDLFNQLRAELKPTMPVPINKQKGEKKAPAYLTGLVNMMIESNAPGIHFASDPQTLTAIARDDAPLRTLARRVDGAFPGSVNPIAIWEIKEYYYSTTFGSRVADGVYESLLDGMELEELRNSTGIHVQHLLMVDARLTWWDQGRSYLCRLVDMLHMGYVDEILFGYEVFEQLPEIVRGWVAELRKRHPQPPGESVQEVIDIPMGVDVKPKP